MTKTMSAKQAHFAEAYVETGNASEAYRQAYRAENMAPNSIHSQASELLKHPKVTERVSALKAENAAAHGRTVAQIDARLEKAFRCAEKKGDANTMRQCAMDLAKLHGLIVERKQVMTHNQSHLHITKAVQEHIASKRR